MTRPYVQQLHQSGATAGQVLTWSAALGYWVPSAAVSLTRVSTVAAGGELLVYLGSVPVTNTEQIFKNGLLLTPGVDYTLSGSTITLTTPLAAGDKVTIYLVPTTPIVIPPFISPLPTGFARPVAVSRPVRRYHRIR